MMERIELFEGQPPHIHIDNVGGHLHIRGWDRDEIKATGDEPQVSKADDGLVHVGSSGDLSLRVPFDAIVDIANVGGDARITDVRGPLTLENVSGDLAVRDIGPLMLQNVGADLRVKRVSGPVEVEAGVGGDATVREVSGPVTLQAVGGDLYVHNVSGACCAERAGGDVVLSTDFLPGHDYRFHAGGDIVCRVPPGADVRFRIPADTELSLDTPEAEVIEGEDGDEVIFGEGQAVIELQAGGEIRLVGEDEDYTIGIGFAQDIEARINEQLAGLDEMISSQVERAVRQAERAARKVEAKLEREAERAARRAERATRKAHKHRLHLNFEAGVPRAPRSPRPPAPPAPPAEPVSNEERMIILRMLEEKKISVDEAEALLAALEGRG